MTEWMHPCSLLRETVFTRRVISMSTAYIRAMHPKTSVMPSLEVIERILKTGWLAQLKIHGHRAQFHIPSDPSQPIIAYNRQGRPHKQALTEAMTTELFRVFAPKKGWNVVDAEWLKPKKKIFVFDFLKKEDKLLRALTYPERWSLLPRHFISPHIKVLPLITDLEACRKALQSSDKHIEGLVFKSGTSKGFSDTSIVRCRKRNSAL